MDLSPKQMKILVDEKLDMSKLLSKKYPDRRYIPGQKCFCPFHDNENTEAGHLYQDEDTGKVTLWCFSEKEQYTTSDALKILLKRDVFSVAASIWDKMSEAQRTAWLTEHDFHKNYEDLFSDDSKPKAVDKELESAKRSFKSGKSALPDLLGKFIK